jgi:hypothetical protein
MGEGDEVRDLRQDRMSSAFGVGNPHPETPLSERRYDGGFSSETLNQFQEADDLEKHERENE